MNLNEGSCLSDGVYHMICGLNDEYQRDSQLESHSAPIDQPLAGLSLEDFLTDVNTSNFVVESDDCSIEYAESVKRILHVCHNIHKQLMQLTVEQFNEQYGMDLDWTGSRKRILECLAMLKANDDSEIVLCFLLLFSILEHSLGDVYVSVNVSKPCPTNLKELLVAKEIQDVIGKNVAMAAFVIAGPPQGVNLRNVLWHGFASGSEIPPQYGSFLVMVIVYIGRKLSSINIDGKRRPIITFSKLDDLLGVFPVIDTYSHLSAISQEFSKTMFVSPRMLPIWEKVLFYYQEQKYGYALVLLMPQLEHSLRRVFTWVNGCPERILTAESTTLYTTFDEMLAALLPDGSENQLRMKIGDNHLEMLMDILVHSEGPRIRDHLSHGEVNLDVVPKALCSHLICICVVFALHFSRQSSILCDDKGKSDKNLVNLSVKNAEDCEWTVDSESVPHQQAVIDSQSMITRQTIIETSTNLSKYQSSNENVMLGHQEIIKSTSNSNCTPKPSLVKSDAECSEPQSHSENVIKKLSIDSTSEYTMQLRYDFIEQLVQVSNNYKSVYHPCQILKREIFSLSKHFENTAKLPCDLHTESPNLSTVNNDKIIEETWSVLCRKSALFSVFSAILTAKPFSVEIYKLCGDIDLQTLYRPRRELEAVSLLRSIIQHCGNMTMQVFNMTSQRYQQWQTKELRSRQRNNYKRLLSLLPFFHSTVKIALLLVLNELGLLQNNTLQPSYLKFLKRALQCSENLESYSSCTKNRWDDCQAVCEQLLELIKNHYTIQNT